MRWRHHAYVSPEAPGHLFSELEQEQATRSAATGEWLCKVLAVKRAIAKVLGAREVASELCSVEVPMGDEGRWAPRPTGDLEQLALVKGVSEFAVSVDTDPAGRATATVIALGLG